jgi:hypothetical protein
VYTIFTRHTRILYVKIYRLNIRLNRGVPQIPEAYCICLVARMWDKSYFYPLQITNIHLLAIKEMAYIYERCSKYSCKEERSERYAQFFCHGIVQRDFTLLVSFIKETYIIS